MGLAEIVQEQIKALPEVQVKEVLDFIGYLKTRQEQTQWCDLMQAPWCCCLSRSPTRR